MQVVMKTKNDYKTASDINPGDDILGGKKKSFRLVKAIEVDVKTGSEIFIFTEQGEKQEKKLSRRSFWDWVQQR